MNKNKARIACGTLIITLLGVVIYGEIQTKQSAAIQTTESTAIDNTRGGNGVRIYGLPEKDRRFIEGSTSGNKDGGRMETTSDREAKTCNNVEDYFPTVSRGAGNIHSVTVDDSLYYYTGLELEKGLLYDLKPMAPLFITAQDKYGIDAVFLAAVAAEESGWGRYQFRKNNIFGFEGFDFSSHEECVDYVARYLSAEYLTPGGKYYEGTSVEAINRHYNGRDSWENNVKQIMNDITKRIERTDND